MYIEPSYRSIHEDFFKPLEISVPIIHPNASSKHTSEADRVREMICRFINMQDDSHKKEHTNNKTSLIGDFSLDEENELFSMFDLCQERNNKLIKIEKQLNSSVAKMVLKVSIENINHVEDELQERIKRIKHHPKYKTIIDDTFENNICLELINKLLLYLRNYVEKECAVEDIISDIKYLTAYKEHRVNNKGEYRCSENEYVNFLKSIIQNYSDKICKNCGTNIRFDEYKFCLVCGRKIDDFR